MTKEQKNGQGPETTEQSTPLGHQFGTSVNACLKALESLNAEHELNGFAYIWHSDTPSVILTWQGTDDASRYIIIDVKNSGNAHSPATGSIRIDSSTELSVESTIVEEGEIDLQTWLLKAVSAVRDSYGLSHWTETFTSETLQSSLDSHSLG